MYSAISNYRKKAEFRKNDRDFRAGDRLELYPVDDDGNSLGGAVLKRDVTHIVFGPAFGIPDGYCRMSID